MTTQQTSSILDTLKQLNCTIYPSDHNDDWSVVCLPVDYGNGDSVTFYYDHTTGTLTDGGDMKFELDFYGVEGSDYLFQFFVAGLLSESVCPPFIYVINEDFTVNLFLFDGDASYEGQTEDSN